MPDLFDLSLSIPLSMNTSDKNSNSTTNGDENVLRCLVSTDNHVGFMENDPIRGDDSFLAFEEVFQKARLLNVDLVLLSGDLFHEFQPSRHTLFRTMEILRQYVLGDNPIKVRTLPILLMHIIIYSYYLLVPCHYISSYLNLINFVVSNFLIPSSS